jgi:hypothetical protein
MREEIERLEHHADFGTHLGKVFAGLHLDAIDGDPAFWLKGSPDD